MESRPQNNSLDAGVQFINRELSWLAFARRVLALVESPDLPLLERIKFAGIMGMLHDEFFMKRMSGLKRQVSRGVRSRSHDGRVPADEFGECRSEILRQSRALARVLAEDLRPALATAGIPILDWSQLDTLTKESLRTHFRDSVAPVLTPLAVDKEHPFPFIRSGGLNLAVILPGGRNENDRFVRIKVPPNRSRWVAVDGGGVVPLEQVIAANLDLMFPSAPPRSVHLFRVTRGAEGEVERADHDDKSLKEPGSIVQLVSSELKARRFAGVVRLQVDASMPDAQREWLAARLGLDAEDCYPIDYFLRLRDLQDFEVPERNDLRFPPHIAATHPRLRGIPRDDPRALFEVIKHGDVLLHHPYHSFDSSVLRFIQAASVDPAVLAIKLTIYRTSSDSPIVKALVEAARRGKQVAVVVEITARFDEAPNIAWGKLLEQEGAHVAYGVESLKTHVKLALVVRQEGGGLVRYAHVGTGNYHTGTARIYEDLGVLTADPEICEEVGALFNQLTGAVPGTKFRHLLVAPGTMRRRFVELIRREADHARAGRPAAIHAKMNQLQDEEIIGELYEASRAGVPIALNVRGVCCLRPGVRGLSETIRVFGVVGRFLEHSRIYRFLNGGDPLCFIGSADWMRRNLDRRVETMLPIRDPRLEGEIVRILQIYEEDNQSAWDCGPDGEYRRRRPAPGESPRPAQQRFLDDARRVDAQTKRLEEPEPDIDSRDADLDLEERTGAASP